MPINVKFYGTKKPTPADARERRKSHPFGQEDNQFDMKTGKYIPLVPDKVGRDVGTYNPNDSTDEGLQPESENNEDLLVLLRDSNGNE